MVTKEQIRLARNADLYSYLIRAHPDEFQKEGGSWLRMKREPGLCTKKGLGGYKNYSTLETGNSVDFLVNHMDYGFQQAVTCLVAGSIAPYGETPAIRQVVLPERVADSYAVRTYLSARGFTDEVIDQLMEQGLLYQDANRNAVFRSSAGDFYEARGTRAGKPFHQCGKMKPDCLWVFIPGGSPDKAYICEGAIDAVSLYLLHLRNGSSTKNAYCGIAGVANQQTIEKIKRWLPAVIAVDNDAAGEQCRIRNAGIPAIIPQHKDWNEDLIHTYSMCKSCVQE